MRLGIIILAHTALHRVAQVARFWLQAGCPVVVHIDARAPQHAVEDLTHRLGADPLVRFVPRHRCDWGTWGLVAATQEASHLMLAEFGEVRHVYLCSGACLPLRPAQELMTYLGARPDTDFIESVTVGDVNWTFGGLEAERFTLRFPVSWQRKRRLFDSLVAVQRRLGYARRVPDGVIPHLGSQWWCLTRRTLAAILQDQKRAQFDRYFRQCWIPDESYFQSLVRRHATRIDSQSLTLSRFDHLGRPHVFYDDHRDLLQRSGCFVARKIWVRADLLYNSFLGAAPCPRRRAEVPNTGETSRVFAKAAARATVGRAGLYMQSCFPRNGQSQDRATRGYSVFQGFSDVFHDFEPWLARKPGTDVHGAIFARDRARFAHGVSVLRGGLTDQAALRDYDPKMFLANLLWSARDKHVCFQLDPTSTQSVITQIARDPNAHVSVISGAWAVQLFRGHARGDTLRHEAAHLQQTEAEMIARLRARETRCRWQIWSLAECFADPHATLCKSLTGIVPVSDRHLTALPKMVDLTGFAAFLTGLRNQGMPMHVVGDLAGHMAEDNMSNPDTAGPTPAMAMAPHRTALGRR